MATLIVREYKLDESEPETTVKIPGTVLKIATKLIPRKALIAMQDQGINLEEIVRLSGDPEVRGVIAEIEDHKDNKRIVISVE
ncbi:hypothetical protein [Desulfonatronum sp. SC1]|uniref:hypothetical protein n=1 Tax=Desulfonatronum sp. SC1 TaxID=2109626 RepID=UPI000D3278DE|nr:hypothetical protein [Desulfonatronum sp. SC1]PTN36003.1 hypothetical protein C6366_10680 [Desulfonatronum sp. SC1]